MRIDEVTANQKDQLDEIFGIGQYFKQRGAFKGGKRVIKATADKLMIELARWLGSQGITSYRKMDHADLVEFLKTKKIPDDFTNNIDTTVDLNARVVRGIITYAARVAVTGRGGKPPVGIKTQYNVDLSRAGTVSPEQNSDASGDQADDDQTPPLQFKSRREIPVGKKMQASDKKTYNWNGKTWTLVSKNGKVTNQRAPNAIANELTQGAKTA